MRVYTFEQILAGKIPEEDFYPHIQQAMHSILRNSPATYTACILGSFARREQNAFSDIDVIWIVKEDQIAASQVAYDEMMKLEQEFFVTIEVILVPLAVAKTAYHTVRPGFRDHLKEVGTSGGTILLNPSEEIANSFLSITEDTYGYIGRKIEKFTLDLVRIQHLDYLELCLVLGKVLSIASHVARKMNQVAPPPNKTGSKPDGTRHGSIQVFLDNKKACTPRAANAIHELAHQRTMYMDKFGAISRSVRDLNLGHRAGAIEEVTYSGSIELFRKDYDQFLRQVLPDCISWALVLLGETLETSKRLAPE